MDPTADYEFINANPLLMKSLEKRGNTAQGREGFGLKFEEFIDIDNVLGKGAKGNVYKITDGKFKGKVIKIRAGGVEGRRPVGEEGGGREKEEEEFEEEAEIMTELGSDGLSPEMYKTGVFSSGMSQENFKHKPFIIMEGFDGDLESLFSNKNVDIDTKIRVFDEGLKKLREYIKKIKEKDNYYVCVDSKPENMLYNEVGNEYEIVLTDFDPDFCKREKDWNNCEKKGFFFSNKIKCNTTYKSLYELVIYLPYILGSMIAIKSSLQMQNKLTWSQFVKKIFQESKDFEKLIENMLKFVSEFLLTKDIKGIKSDKNIHIRGKKLNELFFSSLRNNIGVLKKGVKNENEENEWKPEIVDWPDPRWANHEQIFQYVEKILKALIRMDGVGGLGRGERGASRKWGPGLKNFNENVNFETSAGGKRKKLRTRRRKQRKQKKSRKQRKQQKSRKQRRRKSRKTRRRH